jgi:hypothetical protein
MWIVDKLRAWSDCGGDVTNVMIYWVTQSIGTSFLAYFDYANAGAMTRVGALKNHPENLHLEIDRARTNFPQ